MSKKDRRIHIFARHFRSHSSNSFILIEIWWVRKFSQMFDHETIPIAQSPYLPYICFCDIGREKSWTIDFYSIFKNSYFDIPLHVIVSMDNRICDRFFDGTRGYLIVYRKSWSHGYTAFDDRKDIFMGSLYLLNYRSIDSFRCPDEIRSLIYHF